MKRRLFLRSGSAIALTTLAACGGGGGGSSPLIASAQAASGTEPAAPATAPVAATPQAASAPQSAPATAASALPAKILACYYTAWDTGTYAITDVPMDFNVIYLFHAKPNGTPVNGSWNNVGDGSFFFEFHDAVSAAQVQACRNRGQKVILTVGGASAGFNFDTRAKSTRFVESFKGIAARLGGVDGCDFNNFEANIGSSPAEMVWIASQLKAFYGPTFAITAPPQPNSPDDRAMLKAMADAGVLDVAGPQYYDWSGFNDPGFISRRTDDWVGSIGEGRVMLGLSANYGNGPSLADCIREWDAVKAKYPGVRGMFCWSAQLNLAGGNAWGANMRARL